MPSATPSHLSDEDLINKSLLASLDAQGDAEPNVADDNVHDDDINNPRYPISLQHSRPAPDDQQDQHSSFHPLHPSESVFSINQGLYSSQAQHAHQEYFHHTHPSGAQQTQPAPSKLNGFHTGSNYRNSFTSYPNTTRSRHQATQSGLTAPSTFREQGSTFYPSQDAFSGQMTSPVIQQQYSMYDYGNQSQQHQPQPLQQQQQSLQQQQLQTVANGIHKSPYLIDSYNTSSKPSIQQQQQQSAPSQNQSYPFPNIVQLSSQTPYGPHVPAGISGGVPPSNNANSTNNNAGIPLGLPNSVSQSMLGNNGPTTTANGEEISTIFVVGFPEDMQEREFQNMFTFSPGFEAATLKIPNKDYSAYNPLLGGSGSANGIVGAPGAQRAYGSSNDPYSIVTVNQGGMVVETGRDGMGSWPVAPQADDLAAHYAMGGMGINTLNPLNNLSLNPLSSQAQAAQNALSLTVPRKQIIGFAKFRSREEALVARDVLQGRRVDIDKGAVLKAEMAKKNLHTKRGVGLVGGVGQVGTVGQQGQGPHAAGTALDNLGFGVPEPRIGQWSRETGISQTGQAGIAVPTLSNLQSQEGLAVNGFINGKDGNGSIPLSDEEIRRRDSVSLSGAMGLPSLASLTIGGPSRGAREREEEEREKERRRRGEKDKEMRMRNSAAYDAFHAVAPSSVTSSATINGVAANGASVTSPATNGSNATVGATAMSRQSSGASSGSVWGSPALTAATPATTIDSPGQMQTPGQAYEKPSLSSIEQLNGLHESPLDEDDSDLLIHEQHLQRQYDEEEEFERMQMEQDAELMQYHEQMQGHAQLQAQQVSDDVAIGPWDRIGGASYASVARAPAHFVGGTNASSNVNTHSHTHPSSSSERSTSPDNTVSLGQGQSQSGYIPQFQHLQYHHEQQRQLQMQRQQFGQYHVQHSQPNHGYRTQSESSETSAIDVPVVANPAGYVGAVPSRPLGVHTNAILERLQQHTSSSSSSTSASVSTSASTSALASGSTSAFASSVSSSSSASMGTTGGSANGNGGGVLPLPLTAAGTNVGSADMSAPGSAGNTSPQLPSPAGSGSTASTTSLRGTVDQNPPINTLYVGNLPTSPPPMGYPSDYLEETLREVFASRPGYRKLCFRHKANGPMCFVEFDDVQYATKALTEMSGNTLHGTVKNGIRLSYSKNPLGVRTSNPNSAGGHTTSGNSTPSQAQQLAQALSNSNYHSQGNAQGPPPSSAGSGSDSVQSRDDMVGYQHHRLPTQILRRDSTLSPTSPTYIGANNNNGVNNGNANANGFFASAPRFFNSNPTSPGGSAQLTGASTVFVPRSSAAVNGLSMFGGYGAAAGGFSPFGMPFGANDTQSAFGSSIIHQHQSFAQHSMSEGQHPQQHQQRQADE